MRWFLYAVLALLVAGTVGLALFPLSLALSLAGAPVEGTPSGTVWNGRVEDARAEDVDLGVAQVRAHALPLLRGRKLADLSVDGPSGAGSGLIEAAGQEVQATGVDATVPLAPLGLRGPLGAPLTGQVRVAGDAAFTAAGCTRADLAVETDALAGVLERLGQEGFTLSGPATCEGGTLVARLAGRGASGAADATVRLRPGTYLTELTLSPSDPRAGALLARYGFRPAGGAYTLVTRGAY